MNRQECQRNNQLSSEPMSDIPPTTPGIYRGLPDSVYRAIPAVSQSTLKRFADCPRRFKLAPPIESTPNMRYGSYVDALWLSGDLSAFAVQPEGIDFRTNVGKAWKAENVGKTIITYEQYTFAAAAVARLISVPEIREAREACDVQVAVVAEIDGILCKALIDLCPQDGMRGALGDLKTAPSADPNDWPRYAYDMRLHWQAAMYLDVWNRATGEDLESFFHFVSEQAPPHEPAMLALSTKFIDLGRDQYRRALRQYDDCQKTDVWPGYPVNAVIEPEPWMTRAGSKD